MYQIGDTLTVHAIDEYNNAVILIGDKGVKHYLELPDVVEPAVPDAPTTPAIAVGEVRLHVHMNDMIQLQAKHVSAIHRLNTFGQWWKITQAYEPHAGSVDKQRPAQWFLRSLTRNEGGIHSKIDNLWLCKDNDPSYRIINVCPFPATFNPKDYK